MLCMSISSMSLRLLRESENQNPATHLGHMHGLIELPWSNLLHGLLMLFVELHVPWRRSLLWHSHLGDPLVLVANQTPDQNPRLTYDRLSTVWVTRSLHQIKKWKIEHASCCLFEQIRRSLLLAVSFWHHRKPASDVLRDGHRRWSWRRCNEAPPTRLLFSLLLPRKP